MTDKRAPRAFNLDENGADKPLVEEAKLASKPAPKKAKPTKTRKPRAVKDQAVLRAIPDEAAQRAPSELATTDALADRLTPPPPAKSARRGFRLGRLFWLALTGLVSLGIGLWVDQLVRDLFSRQDWLGWVAVGLTALLILAALGIVVRELNSLRRMAKIDGLREDAARAVVDDDMKLAKSVAAALDKLYEGRPDTARGRAALSDHAKEIIDGSDLIALIERDLMKPLDAKARALVMGSAKRVSVVTAVSPRAIVDIGFVLVENARLIRRLAELYGGRPTTLGFWRLARNVIGHLAVTGSIAVGDGLLQQVVGHGLAAKVSSRLGEGVVNGLLTARIGIAAIDVCRPLPFTDQTRPTVKDFMGELVSFSGNTAETEAKTNTK